MLPDPPLLRTMRSRSISTISIRSSVSNVRLSLLLLELWAYRRSLGDLSEGLITLASSKRLL